MSGLARDRAALLPAGVLELRGVVPERLPLLTAEARARRATLDPDQRVLGAVAGGEVGGALPLELVVGHVVRALGGGVAADVGDGAVLGAQEHAGGIAHLEEVGLGR